MFPHFTGFSRLAVLSGLPMLTWFSVLSCFSWLSVLPRLARLSGFANFARLTHLPMLARLAIIGGLLHRCPLLEGALTIAVEAAFGTLVAFLSLTTIGPLMSVPEARMVVVLALRPGFVLARIKVGGSRLFCHGIADDHGLIAMAAVVWAAHLVIADFVAVGIAAHVWAATAVDLLAGLLLHLLAIGENYAIIMLCVLQVIFR